MKLNDVELCNTPSGVVMVYPIKGDPYALSPSNIDVVTSLFNYIDCYYHEAFEALTQVYCKSERNLPYYRFKVVSRFIRCNMGNLDTQEVDLSDNTMHLEEVSCPLRGSGDCFFENIVCKPKSTLPLTPQQRRVYKLYADGLNTVEIAEAMCLAIATIERHRKDIQQRLSLHSLSDMISFYHKKHLNLD